MQRPTVAPRRGIELLGLGLAALAVACSFDAGKLRAPGVRDAGLPADAPDAARSPDGPSQQRDGAGDPEGGADPDVGTEVWASGDSLVFVDLADATGVDVVGPGTGGAMAPVDVAGTGGSGGATSDAQGAGGTAGDVGAMGGVDVGGTTGDDTAGGAGAGGTGGGTGGGSGGGSGGGGMGGTDASSDVASGGSADDGGDAAAMDALDTANATFDAAGDEGLLPTLETDLVLWYRFDESGGTVAYDSARWGGVSRDATLATTGFGANVTFTSTKQVGTHALAFPTSPSSGGYVNLPVLHDLAPDAVTIAVWVRLSAATAYQNWERVFDYGDTTTSPCWFNLAARNGSTPFGPVFAMSNTGHPGTDQHRLTGSTALTPNTWHHLAIVLPAGAPYTGVMYIDGVVVATNDAMTLHLSDIGATPNNWLGRSEFTNDPYFSGSMDDFRVYRRALSQQEIAALMELR